MDKSEKVRILITGIIFNLFTMTFGRFAYTLILPEMKRVLGFTNTAMGIFGMGIVIGYLANSFFSGKISEIIGERATVKISVFIASVSLFMVGYFKNPLILFLGFILIGAGTAGSYIPMVALINRKFEKKGPAFGLVMDGAGIGIMLTGYLLPLVLESNNMQGYRYAWYSLGAVNMLGLVAGIILLRGKDEDRRIESKGNGEKSPSIIKIFFSNKPLVLTILIYFLLGFSYIIYVTFFGDYVVNEIGFSTKTAGFMWSLFGINTIYSGILWGFISEKKNKLNVGIIVNLLLFFSIITIIIFRMKLIFYLSTFLFGLAFMGFIITITSIISGEVQKDFMAKTFGAGTFMHGTGQVFGTFLAGLIKDATGTFKTSFLMSAVALLVNLYLFLKIKKITSN